MTACISFSALLMLTQLVYSYGWISTQSTYRRPVHLNLKAELIIGLNKYSHDASCCIINADDGKILFAQAKERVSRRKHDGGAVGDLISYGLETIGASKDDVSVIVSNNHHHRVIPFERRLPFYGALKYTPQDYLDPMNLFTNAKHYELSHHLAHAWSAISTSGFDNGLVLIMDGMGETYKAMREDISNIEEHSGDYMHDLKLLRACSEEDSSKFIGVPKILSPGSGYREAESAYIFKDNTLKPIFKRWSRERSPPELYNHGFENHQSLGAVYSRISSHIFGDWNACGKVMGLAPWSGRKPSELNDWFFPPTGTGAAASANTVLGSEFHHEREFMGGNPLFEESFHIHWDMLDSLPSPNQFEAGNSKFDYYSHLASSVQTDLENSAMSLVTSLKDISNESNLILSGGVALNSVLNGRIRREKVFDKIHIPSAPGDEGIAIGCAQYGLHRHRQRSEDSTSDSSRSDSGSDSSSQDQKSNSPLQVSFFTTTTTTTTTCSSPTSTSTTESPEHSTHQSCGCSSGQVEGEHNHNHNHDENLNHSEGNVIVVEDEDEVQSSTSPSQTVSPSVPVFPAYLGREYSRDDIEDALSEFSPWLSIEEHTSEDNMVEAAANRLAEGQVIAWFQGRSEFGQRALGSRSILADPRQASLRRFINEEVKRREWFRPLAPSVLASAVGDWFDDIENGENASPYMSLTAVVKEGRREEVPAICHIDGSARLQTVTMQDNSLYHKLISAFCTRTGIPMILNTSFNGKGEPIVESPIDAILALLACNNKISTMYIGNYEVHIRPFPFESSGLASLASDPSSAEAEIIVKAKRFYLSEVVASPFTPDSPVRIRVQTGQSESESDGGWKTLPSSLHLELLQLLQIPPDADYEGEEQVSDILDAIRSIREEENELSWQEVKEALRWLYFEGLVSFRDSDYSTIQDNNNNQDDISQQDQDQQSEQERYVDGVDGMDGMDGDSSSNSIGNGDDDIDFEGLFKGVEIVDLRNPSPL
eukprot:gene6504-13133_t